MNERFKVVILVHIVGTCGCRQQREQNSHCQLYSCNYKR